MLQFQMTYCCANNRENSVRPTAFHLMANPIGEIGTYPGR